MVDVSKFSVAERKQKYRACFEVRGTVIKDIDAQSLSEAEQKADEIMKNQELLLGLIEEIEDVSVYIRPPMYRAIRNGVAIQTTHLLENDEPRGPEEDGF